MVRCREFTRRVARGIGITVLCCVYAGSLLASNHLDGPTSAANPQANIGDLYAWTSPDGHRLNLVMDIVARSFSDRLAYTFHIDSGKELGKTTDTVSITCQFHNSHDVECRAGDYDFVRGDASRLAGLRGLEDRFRVFAGLRDDPFFFNLAGFKAAAATVHDALPSLTVDAAGCPASSQRKQLATSPNGDPAQDAFKGQNVLSNAVSVDKTLLARQGPILGIWASTHKVRSP